jgi:hypothetical protein
MMAQLCPRAGLSNLQLQGQRLKVLPFPASGRESNVLAFQVPTCPCSKSRLSFSRVSTTQVETNIPKLVGAKQD